MRGKPVIIILATVLLVVYGRLTLDYMKQRQEQAALTTQIADARQILAQIPEPPADLEESLAAAEARLSSAQRFFPTRLNSTQVINYILELARQHDVTAIPLVTRAWSTEKVQQHDYKVFRLNLDVAGSYPQLVTFLSELEKGQYPTLMVNYLNVHNLTEPPEDETANVGTTDITARLELAIYTR